LSPVLQHLTLREIGRLLPRETLTSYFKFAIVRNPWERLLSNYLFERNHYLHFHPRETEYLSLPDYIDQLNPFLRQPQTDFIRAGEVQLDYLGRFERLDEDFAQIAGCLRQPPGKLAHLNRTRPRALQPLLLRGGTPQGRKPVCRRYRNTRLPL
jgi:hypothetical protein